MDLKIPKQETTVEMAMVDGREGRTEDFLVYLNQFSQFHSGPESLEEFLNSHQLFIPITRPNPRTFYIQNVNQILFIKEKEPSEIQAQVKLRLLFKNGSTIDVDHFEPMPQYHSRPVDYFNRDLTFLTFGHQGFRIHINKYNIRQVAILEKLMENP